MKLLLQLLRIENEDNAVLILKIITDLHRTYALLPGAPPRPKLDFSDPLANVRPPGPLSPVEMSADELLEIVSDLFKGMGAVVEDVFSENTPAPPTPAAAPTPGAEGTDASPAALPTVPESEGGPLGGPVQLAPAMKSFKVLQECPTAIVFIFQTYTYLTEKAVNWFVPLVFEVRSRSLGEEGKADGTYSFSLFKRRLSFGSISRWSKARAGLGSALTFPRQRGLLSRT